MTREQKNAVAAAVLLPVAAYFVYSSFFSGAAPSSSTQPVRVPQKLQTIDLARDAASAVAGGGPRVVQPAKTRSRVNTSQEWVPRVGGRRPEDRADPAKTDPTLRLELLARLQGLEPIAPGRSLFDFTNAPVALPPDVRVKPDPKKLGKGGPPPPAVPEPPPAPTGPPPEPPPPAIPLKFYGFVQGQGGKRAFFRLGEEEIFMASEGQTIQARYRIVRIGLSSAMVEDVQYKNNQQSLRIEEIPKESL